MAKNSDKTTTFARRVMEDPSSVNPKALATYLKKIVHAHASQDGVKAAPNGVDLHFVDDAAAVEVLEEHFKSSSMLEMALYQQPLGKLSDLLKDRKDFIQSTLAGRAYDKAWAGKVCDDAEQNYFKELRLAVKANLRSIKFSIDDEVFRRQFLQRDPEKDPDGSKTLTKFLGKRAENEAAKDRFTGLIDTLLVDPSYHAKTDVELAAMEIIAKKKDGDVDFWRNVLLLPAFLKKRFLREDGTLLNRPGAGRKIPVIKSFGALSDVKTAEIVLRKTTGKVRFRQHGSATPKELVGTVKFKGQALQVDLRGILRWISDPDLLNRFPSLHPFYVKYRDGVLTQQDLIDMMKKGGYIYRIGPNREFRRQDLRIARGTPTGTRARASRYMLRLNFQPEVASHPAMGPIEDPTKTEWDDATGAKIVKPSGSFEGLQENYDVLCGFDLGQNVLATIAAVPTTRLPGFFAEVQVGKGDPNTGIDYFRVLANKDRRPSLPSLVVDINTGSETLARLKKQEDDFYANADIAARNALSEEHRQVRAASANPTSAAGIATRTANVMLETSIGNWFTQNHESMKKGTRMIANHLKSIGVDPVDFMEKELGLKAYPTKDGGKAAPSKDADWQRALMRKVFGSDLAEANAAHNFERFQYVTKNYPKNLTKAKRQFIEANLNLWHKELQARGYSNPLLCLDGLSFEDGLGRSRDSGLAGWSNMVKPLKPKSQSQKMAGIAGVVKTWVKNRGLAHYVSGANHTSQFDYVEGVFDKARRGGKRLEDGTVTPGKISDFHTKNGIYDADCFGALGPVVKYAGKYVGQDLFEAKDASYAAMKRDKKPKKAKAA